MTELDLYKMLTMLATFRAGGQIVVSAKEIDDIQKDIDALRIGVIDGDKVLIRIIPK